MSLNYNYLISNELLGFIIIFKYNKSYTYEGRKGKELRKHSRIRALKTMVLLCNWLNCLLFDDGPCDLHC